MPNKNEDTASPINVNNSIYIVFLLLLLATVPARLCVTKAETNEKHIASRICECEECDDGKRASCSNISLLPFSVY